jgi:hypothetical protein
LNDEDIGDLDKGWNYLEGWYPAHYDRLHAVHYTLGGPWFTEKIDCDFSELWLNEYKSYSSRAAELRRSKYPELT